MLPRVSLAFCSVLMPRHWDNDLQTNSATSAVVIGTFVFYPLRKLVCHSVLLKSAYFSHISGDPNIHLVPACLFLDRYASWLAWALEAATRIPFRPSSSGGTSDRVALTFNPSNCQGTVLAVNGFRRYFHMYHPLLPGAQSRSSYLKLADKVKSNITKCSKENYVICLLFCTLFLIPEFGLRNGTK